MEWLKKHPSSTSVSNLLFRLWLLFLAFITAALLSYPSITKLRMQSYYSNNFADIFTLLDLYLNELDQSSAQELFDRIFIVSGISIELENLESNILDSGRFLSNTIKVENYGSNYLKLDYYSYTRNRKISMMLEAPIKQYTMAVMYLLTQTSNRYGIGDRKVLWNSWQNDLKVPFEATYKKPFYLTMAEKQELNSQKPIWTLDNLNQISVIYQYDKSTYLLYGKIQPFEKYPLNLMLFIISMGGLLLTIGLGLILKKINKDLFLIYLSAIRIFRGEDKNEKSPIEDVKILDSINKIFEDGSARIEKARREQQELVAAVSHELRTPLARLMFSIQMTEDAKTLEEAQKHIGSMIDDVEELNVMVDEILTYNRLDKTGVKLHLKQLSLERISQNVINNLYTLPKFVEVDLIVENEDKVSKILADEKYIQRAIHNLVTNANRYAKSKIIIRLTYLDNLVEIRVEDDGIGIPEQDRENVFSPFVRLDNSRNRSSGGYGLGLSIVNKVVIWHKAKVSVGESETLGGASFKIEIAKDLSKIQNP